MIRHTYDGAGFAPFAGREKEYDKEFLLGLLRSMLRIRIVEQEIEARYHQDLMKTPIHLVIGQEATSVGACAALRREDLVYSSHRTHGNYLAKGGDLKAMLSELHCRTNGCAGSRGGSMHLIDKSVGLAGTSAIVGGSLPIATGAALASQLRNDDRVAVVFFGEAAAEEGVSSESLNFASLRKVPIVFFCENNFYSVQSPLGPRQPAGRNLRDWAESYAMASVRTDGTNVLAVYETVREAVARARRGDGPTFIEAPVYRFRAHGGAGDDSKTGYRAVEEREHWEKLCPIETYYTFLRAAGLVDDFTRKRFEQEFRTEILEAFEHALASPEPVEQDLYRHVYAE